MLTTAQLRDALETVIERGQLAARVLADLEALEQAGAEPARRPTCRGPGR